MREPEATREEVLLGDLPKEFVHAKLQGLLDTQVLALVEVMKCIEHGPFSGPPENFWALSKSREAWVPKSGTRTDSVL